MIKLTGQHALRRTPDHRRAFVPMIDIVFLLLVYFVTTYSYNPPESDIAPALENERSTAAGNNADFQVQIVDVAMFDGEVGFRVGSRILRDQASLEALLRRLPKDAGVFVRGSDAVRTSAAVAALQAARDAGFTKVTYVPGD